MPRPTRIEYEGAFHHVMNRGHNHENIFHDKRYLDEFLKCLKEASEQFDAVIHAYKKKWSSIILTLYKKTTRKIGSLALSTIIDHAEVCWIF